MLLRKFREVTPDVIILIVLIAIIVWIGAFIRPDLPSAQGYDQKPMPLFGLMLSISGYSPILSEIFAFLIVLLISFLIVNFNTSVLFIGERTFLPALIFVLFSGLFPKQQILNPGLPAAVFLVLAIRRIIDTYKIQGTAYPFYDAGFLISTGALFYADFIWFGVLLVIGIVILRTGNPREIIISLLGLATPWFLIFGFYYINGSNLSDLSEIIKFNLFIKKSSTVLSRLNIAVLAVIGVILVISLTNLFTVINTKKIRSRKTFSLLIWTLVIAAGVLIFSHATLFEIFWLLSIPACYIISHYFVFAGRKRLIPQIYFLALFLCVALVQIFRVA